MKSFSLVLHAGNWSDFRARFAERIFNRIETLSDQPRPRGSVKLRGSANLWRIRAGDYRVIYSVDDRSRIVDVSAVRHRGDAYR